VLLPSEICDKWQQTSNPQTQNKFYQIYPTMPSYFSLPSSCQWKEPHFT